LSDTPEVPQRVLDAVYDSTPEDWHSHSNGGGWVYKTATVEPSAYLHPTSIVSGDAQVYGNAQVSGNARVYGNAQVSGNAWVYGDARVYGNARVYGDARVSGDAWEKSPTQIQGSRHFVTLCSLDQIAIGCHVHDFAYWREHFKAIGKTEGYSKDEVAEYGEYIDLLIKRAGQIVAKRDAEKVAESANPVLAGAERKVTA
jgi:hypothetical protein